MSYSPCGCKELDTTEQLHFLSFAFWGFFAFCDIMLFCAHFAYCAI